MVRPWRYSAGVIISVCDRLLTVRQARLAPADFRPTSHPGPRRRTSSISLRRRPGYGIFGAGVVSYFVGGAPSRIGSDVNVSSPSREQGPYKKVPPHHLLYYSTLASLQRLVSAPPRELLRTSALPLTQRPLPARHPWLESLCTFCCLLLFPALARSAATIGTRLPIISSICAGIYYTTHPHL